MILIDTGPLVAVLNRRDQDHAKCSAFLLLHGKAFITTWSVMTEAHYFVGKLAGWSGQSALWKLVERGVVDIADSSSASAPVLHALMEKYCDVPMDLADASLVALAEVRDIRVVFTLDSDFEVYRKNGRQTFQLRP